jgi:hypothetical protein
MKTSCLALNCYLHFQKIIKKKKPLLEGPASVIYNYKYTITPLSVFKKIDVKERGKKVVYNIHLVALYPYKINLIFKRTNKKY